MLRALVGLLLLAVAAGAGAETPRLDHERITEFDVRLEVEPSGRLTVTERIAVVALGREIRRGIFRDLPLVRASLLGRSLPAFTILSVRRNGEPEHFHTEGIGDGIRIYIGREDVLIEHGVHAYELRYAIERQIDFYDQVDELYWNATGDRWSFLIERARATVVVPDGAAVVDAAGFTGRPGSTERAVAIERGAGSATVAATRQLAPGEGLTVAVSWPKGFVAYPAPAEQLWHGLLDNRMGLVALVVLALVSFYYLVVWSRAGRDPQPGTIVPVYEPRLPPAAMRYIQRMGYDSRCFTTAVVSMAVKGHLTIAEDGSEFMLTRTGEGHTQLSDGERKLFQALFARGAQSVRLGQAARGTLVEAAQALKGHFDATFNRHYFRRNRGYFAAGAALTLLGWALIALMAPGQEDALFLSVWMAGWTVGTAMLLWQALGGLRQGLVARELGQGAQGLLKLLFAIPFLGGWLFGAWLLAEALGVAVALVLLVATLVNLLFFHLLRAPTALGREALDEIEGARLYLTVAERDRLQYHHPREGTPELFEQLLPYAIALNVETAWTNRFADVLEGAKRPEQPAYRPSWYQGTRFTPSNLGGLSTSIASAVSSATAPRSSGGGSSGGGRGGGGGGGW